MQVYGGSAKDIPRVHFEFGCVAVSKHDRVAVRLETNTLLTIFRLVLRFGFSSSEHTGPSLEYERTQLDRHVQEHRYLNIPSYPPLFRVYDTFRAQHWPAAEQPRTQSWLRS